jgi:hypothetical protein
MIMRLKSIMLVGILLVLDVAVAAPATAADRTAPRIVAAAMQDADRDGRADRLVLRYSERVNHVVDRAGFPFTVAGYRIGRVERARSSLTLVVTLRERRTPDPSAKPSVRCRRTSQQPVRDRAGNQAANQTFRKTTAFRRPTVPPPAPAPAPLPSPGAPGLPPADLTAP